MSIEERHSLGAKAKDIVDGYYSWEKIRDEYEELFLEG